MVSKNLKNNSNILQKMANDILVFYRAQTHNEDSIFWGNEKRLSLENNIERIQYTSTTSFIIGISTDRLAYGLCGGWNEEDGRWENTRRIMFEYYNFDNIPYNELDEFAKKFAPYIKKELIRIHPDVEPNNLTVNVDSGQLNIVITRIIIETKVRLT